MAVNSTKDLATTVGNFYKSFNFTTPNIPAITLPYKDEISSGNTRTPFISIKVQSILSPPVQLVDEFNLLRQTKKNKL